MSEKKGLPRPPFYANEYIEMAEILEFSFDDFGRLILAIMYYTADGTIPEDLPDNLRMMFSIYQRKIDYAREKYEQKCATNAENGAKGGKAKSENAKRQSSGAKFIPPTQKQFHESVQHFVDEDELPNGISNYAVDSFFDELKDAGWTIGGEKIQNRPDWERAILAKFYNDEVPNGMLDHFPYMYFKEIFSKYHGLRDDAGLSQALDAQAEFLDRYDEATKTWVIQGEIFRLGEWAQAITRFMERYSESSDT